ncbi:cell surface protein [Candidatus Mancarchaeum acidiphilum]|uniref:Cell surface protein n=1 Tax=Candidatus Mancarchaeum acidiphilum TaxID=1920749 RepID=A0A218NMI1_9ARCH|nr:hypothetical protein [Candidatus Mancarchaeum acidiphilum]ASI13666.1 cell surface protein [Candidatus Mancarchaeum acidiphilum]
MSKFIVYLSVMIFATALLGVASAQGSDSFTLINAYFGSNGTVINPVPGQNSVPLTLVIESNQDKLLSNTSLELYNFNSGFKPINGQGSITEELPDVKPDQTFSITYYIDIPSYAREGTYYLDLEIEPNNTVSEEYTMLVPFIYGGVPSIKYTSDAPHLIPGEINNLTININDTGSGSVTSLQPYFSSEQPINGQNSSIPSIKVLSSPAKIGYLGVNQTVQENLSVYVPESAAGSIANIEITSKYLNYYGQQGMQNYTLSIPVEAPSNLVINETDSSAYLGKSTALAFKIENIGGSAVKSVVATLSTEVSGISITGNSTSYFTSIPAGSNVTYSPTIAVGPSVSEGGYAGTLDISYENQLGQQEQISYPIGFTAVGLTSLVTETPSVSAISEVGNVPIATVSGSLVDEGSGNAYYVTVYAYLKSNGKVIGSNSSYVGEIQLNSPMPFSVTVIPNTTNSNSFAAGFAGKGGFANKTGAFANRTTANKSAANSTDAAEPNYQNLTIEVYEKYQNSFSQNMVSTPETFAVPKPVAYNASAFAKYKVKTNNYTGYYVIAAVIIVIILAFAYRSKKSKSKKHRTGSVI